MVKFNEVKIGDYLQGEYEGKKWKGQVTRLNSDEKQICLRTNVQDFFFDPENVYPLPISNESIMALNFKKEVADNGEVKYKKGSFRILIPKEGDWTHMDIWYREDRRHYPAIQYIHQLQSHYLQMTKIHLTNEVMV